MHLPVGILGHESEEERDSGCLLDVIYCHITRVNHAAKKPDLHMTALEGRFPPRARAISRSLHGPRASICSSDCQTRLSGASFTTRYKGPRAQATTLVNGWVVVHGLRCLLAFSPCLLLSCSTSCVTILID